MRYDKPEALGRNHDTYLPSKASVCMVKLARTVRKCLYNLILHMSI